MEAHGAGIFVFPDGALIPETVAVPQFGLLHLVTNNVIIWIFASQRLRTIWLGLLAAPS